MFSRQHIALSTALMLLFLFATPYLAAQDGATAQDAAANTQLRSPFVSVKDTFFVRPGSTQLLLEASASSGLTVEWRLIRSTGARLSGDTLHFTTPLSAGSFLYLEAFQSGNTQFRPATPVRVVISLAGVPATPPQNPGRVVPSVPTSASMAEVDCYPNPFVSVLSIRVKNYSQPASVRIFDINGQLKATRRLAGTESELDLSPLPKGVYMVQIRTGSKEYTRRVFKNQ